MSTVHRRSVRTRGQSYYLKVVLPITHPANMKYRVGRMVQSLGACTTLEATSEPTILHASILQGASRTFGAGQR